MEGHVSLRSNESETEVDAYNWDACTLYLIESLEWENTRENIGFQGGKRCKTRERSEEDTYQEVI